LNKVSKSSEPVHPNGILDHLKKFGGDFKSGLMMDKHFDASEFLMSVSTLLFNFYTRTELQLLKWVIFMCSQTIYLISTSKRHLNNKATCVEIFGGQTIKQVNFFTLSLEL
jgi:hypothetical protein